ncbi:hypothetical protein EUTSA_v10001209mg [Eutrema salsugineum]|uniref:Glycosyltransferase n=1 Tax=Eutrema salsugineum TaxID=72664 RepID=V4LIH2_EUTSA|nr:hypothetical protein EUTSA_v10001209mg [Eutrema salsugineum]
MKNTSSESSPADGKDDDIAKSPSSGSQRDLVRLMLLFTTVALSCILVYKSSGNPLMLLPPWKSNWFSQNQTPFNPREQVWELKRVLMNASMEDKTVIITTLNKAWVAPNSIFDLFLESFRIGIGTKKIAYKRCLQVHPHCYFINATDSNKLAGPNKFLSPGYLTLMWRRLNFLREVIALGYNFIFTDADILWFRDPFPRFFPNADFQIACDNYNGNSYDKSNWVNAGFIYVKANNKTSKFYKFWSGSRRRFRGRKHDQDVFNLIKRDPFVAKIGIKIRFLNTVYFGGFCQPSKDINVVNTMHSNCCTGLNSKTRYLNGLLRDWKQYLSGNTTLAETKWKRRHRCGRHWR